MQSDSIERIRGATFSIARKGYDKREVERFLNKLADWLEAGGGDQARSELVKRELERVGEKTARVLSEAEDSAEQIRTEAAEEAAATLDGARENAATTRRSAEEHAAKALADGEAKAQRIVEEGTRRRTDLEAVISDLVRRRDALLADIERLTSELRSAVSGHAPRPGADPFATPRELDPAERGAEGREDSGEQVRA
ncbi:MAG: DivIVA domain-containing protein [Solirubrobacterales bacterium]